MRIESCCIKMNLLLAREDWMLGDRGLVVDHRIEMTYCPMCGKKIEIQMGGTPEGGFETPLNNEEEVE